MLGDVAPGELAGMFGMPSNLVAHHLRVLGEAGLIERVRSEGDLRRSYVRLVPNAFAALIPDFSLPAARVVFVCTHNSARSQLAAAAWTASSRVPATSAGTHPADRVHPTAIAVARAHRLPLKRGRTAHLDAVMRSEDWLSRYATGRTRNWGHRRRTGGIGQYPTRYRLAPMKPSSMRWNSSRIGSAGWRPRST